MTCGVSLTGHKFYQLSPKQWQSVEYQYISLSGLSRVMFKDGLNIITGVTVIRGGFVQFDYYLSNTEFNCASLQYMTYVGRLWQGTSPIDFLRNSGHM
jgi:hypothetical protein